MISSILKLGYPGVSTGDVVAATKSIRKELSKTDTPITYTDLRIQAIQLELERCLERLAGPELSGVVDLSVSRRIFDVWLQARHEAAERYLFDGTVDMLEEVSKFICRPQLQSSDLAIGGRGEFMFAHVEITIADN